VLLRKNVYVLWKFLLVLFTNKIDEMLLWIGDNAFLSDISVSSMIKQDFPINVSRSYWRERNEYIRSNGIKRSMDLHIALCKIYCSAEI
jgi:hypothetical protein